MTPLRDKPRGSQPGGKPAPIDATRAFLALYHQGRTHAALCLWHGIYCLYGRGQARLLLEAVCHLDGDDVRCVHDFLWMHAPETIDTPEPRRMAHHG